MKALLTVSGLIEGVTGLVLGILPSLLVSLLLGTPITDPTAILLGRLTGASLLSIASACLLSRTAIEASVMVKVMLGYNILSTTLLVYAGSVEKISGPGLWPAVLVHLGLLAWCITSLSRKSQDMI
jgi:hypothetical protein